MGLRKKQRKRKEERNELATKIIRTRKIHYTNNKYPRRKQNRKRSIEGYNRRKLKEGEEGKT